MNHAATDGVSGLDLILDDWSKRFVFDSEGRLVALRIGGVPPRLIFARSAEGCVWRLRADLPLEQVGGIAKLAGRERGWRASEGNGADPPPPERLVMIARLLGGPDSPAPYVRESIVEGGILRAEVWLFN